MDSSFMVLAVFFMLMELPAEVCIPPGTAEKSENP